uniref:Uncharacterized protein n=1 Tax=Melanopsichium pennsylvanicum 4 TaxID=1398559 RepID=A0A077QRR5_9BASI|nr:uncharacterized protein BN887_06057 [Melanopsichium pennsylvanicum 4]
MVRGHAKQAAQEAAKKKAAGQSGGKSQLGEARQKGLKFTCPTCKGEDVLAGYLEGEFSLIGLMRVIVRLQQHKKAVQ